jgi:hypothetical protein
MTPLAHKIVSELTLPLNKRTFRDSGSVLRDMGDIHCFECSDIQELAASFGRELTKADEPSIKLQFLPAERTWIEFKRQEGRFGLWCSKANHKNKEIIAIKICCADASGGFGSFPFFFAIDTENWSGKEFSEIVMVNPNSTINHMELNKTKSNINGMIRDALGYIACINTPKVIGRKQHMPHRGLERALLQQQKIIGKYPLNAWHEIKLEVTPTMDCSHLPGYEARLTGRKALHFCRAHLRIKRGKLEIVKQHWRGDPALGIKQARYRVTDGAAHNQTQTARPSP